MDTIISNIQLNKDYSDCYLIYTRKSTDDADNQKNSIEYQMLEVAKYSTREVITIADDFSLIGFCEQGMVEEYHSGFKQDANFLILKDGTISQKVERPKFLMMIELLQKRLFKGIVCLCWDRLSRNEGDDVLIKKLIKQGLDIRFVQVEYDKSSSGDLHMDIDGVFSRHYSRVISEKVKMAAKKLREEGKCIYLSPLGYLDNGSESKPFDAQRAPIVKRVFELYATGEWSYRALAHWANQQHLTTKPVRRKRSKSERLEGVKIESIPKISRKVTVKAIENILKNPFYIGMNVTGDEWIRSIAHQALIDSSLFYKVQSMMKQRTVTVHYPELQFYPYRGLIKCNHCNCSYSPYTKKGINYYSSKCKEDCPNKNKNINDAFIEKHVSAIIQSIAFTDAERAVISERAIHELGIISEKRNKELDDLYRQLNSVMADLDYLIKQRITLLRTGAMTMGQITEEEYRLNQNIETIQLKIKANSESTKAMLDYVITFSGLVKEAGIYFNYALDSEKRDLVLEIFSELKIDNKELKYAAKQGFQALLNRKDAPNFESGSADYLFSELGVIYAKCKITLPLISKIMNVKIAA